MEELLVIFACLNNTGCPEVSGHYYNTHPHARDIFRNGERVVEEYAGPVVLATIGPAVVYSIGGSGNIHLYQNFSLQISKKNVILGYTREF